MVRGVHYRAIPTLRWAPLLIVLVRLLLRNTAGFRAARHVRGAWFLSPPGCWRASGIYSHWWTGTLGAILIPLIGSVWFVASGYSPETMRPRPDAALDFGWLKLGACRSLALVCVSVASVIALVAGWSRMAGIQEILECCLGRGYHFYRGELSCFAPGHVGCLLVVGRGFPDGNGFAAFSGGGGHRRFRRFAPWAAPRRPPACG